MSIELGQVWRLNSGGPWMTLTGNNNGTACTNSLAQDVSIGSGGQKRKCGNM